MRHQRFVIAAAGVSALIASGLLLSTPALGAASDGVVSGPIACPNAFPVAQAVDGVTGTGYTVERGNRPAPFTASVLGRITSGILPGLDLIMADLSSPALTKAGGVWAGMSGSPVYSSDGRLIGSVSYGLAANSTIAGLTPGSALKSLVNDIDDRTITRLPGKVAVDRAAVARLVRTGKVTAAAAQAGFSPLRMPLVLSGGASPNAAKFLAHLTAGHPDSPVITSGAAASGTAPASSITAGSNFAEVESYGDITFGGIGTTTFVCAGKAIAFGHPLNNLGVTTYGVNASTALFVQPDPLYGPFKVANLGGVVGTIDRDRFVGVRGRLGLMPASTLITSTLTRSTGQSRTGTSHVIFEPAVADVAAYHTEVNVESVLGSVVGGSASVTLTIKGTRANGTTFSVTRSDRFSSSASIGFTVADFVYYSLSALVNQSFEQVRIERVAVTGTISPQVAQYHVSAVKVKQGGVYVTPAEGATLAAKAGAALPVRVTLTPYLGIGATKTVDLSPVVPRGTSGSTGNLTVTGGVDPYAESAPARSFADILAGLRTSPSNASVRASVSVDAPTGTLTGKASAPTDAFVELSERSFTLEIG